MATNTHNTCLVRVEGLPADAHVHVQTVHQREVGHILFLVGLRLIVSFGVGRLGQWMHGTKYKQPLNPTYTT